MSDSLTVLAEVGSRSFSPPIYVAALFMAVLVLSAILIILFMARYFCAETTALRLGVSPKTLKRSYIGELLWVFVVVAAGATVELLSDSRTVNLANKSLMCVGVLSLVSTGYFITVFVRRRLNGVFVRPLECTERIVLEAVWVFWLVTYGSSVLTDVVEVCRYFGDYRVTWLEYVSAHGFNRLEGVLLIIIRVYGILLKFHRSSKQQLS